MKRFLIALLCLTLLCGSVFATEGRTELDLLIHNFMRENNLDRDNFAISYFSAVESYNFNETALFPSGELWEFSMHMYYHEMEFNGTYDAPADDPDYVFTIEGLTLDECRTQSITMGNNKISEAMRHQIGDTAQFKIAVDEAFGHCFSEGQWPDEFLMNLSYFSTKFWMNSLKSVYADPEVFPELLASYKEVQTYDGLAAYGKPYPITSIRSEEDGMISNIAVVEAVQPYLLVCYVSEEAGGDAILANLNAALCEYADEAAGVTFIPAASSAAQISREDALAVPFAKDNRSGAYLWIGIALGGALLIAAVVGLILWLIRRQRGKDYYDY